MVTVAEGVETADQVRYLRSLECHMAQGFFYSKPQPPSVIDRILAQPPTEGWRPDRVAAQAAHAQPPRRSCQPHPAAPPPRQRTQAARRLVGSSSVVLAKPSDRRLRGEPLPRKMPSESNASRRRRQTASRKRRDARLRAGR